MISRIPRVLALLATILATSLLTAGVADAAPARGVPCGAGAKACVRLSTNQAWLLDGGRVVTGPVRISSGRPGYRTPPGTFRVSYKAQDHVSTIYDQAMPYSVFFNGGIAFHQGSVRVPSHGCIHLGATAARTFFGKLQPGDVVQVVR